MSGARREIGAQGAAVLLAALVACSAGSDGRNASFEASRARALEYFATQVRETDPSWSAIFGHLHRRFGIAAVDAAGRPLHVPPADERRPEIAAIYRRLWEPASSVRKEQIASLESFIDRMTANALHCDRIPLPDDWETVLRHASNAGAYALTHAAVAGQWSIENGCRQRSELAGLQSAQVVFLERLAEQHEKLVATHAAGNDVWIEALAMLHYLDAGDRVRPTWLDALLASQRPDGGWNKGGREDRSDPHPTALAIWVLTAQLQPDAPPVPWVATR